MIKKNTENYTELKLDDLCEECQKNDESVIHNLILTGFKICKSCRVKNNFSNLSYITYWQCIHSTHNK